MSTLDCALLLPFVDCALLLLLQFADCALLLHGLDPIPQRVVLSGGAAREAAAGTLGSISGFPSVAPKARIWRTSRLQFYDVLAPAEGLPPSTAQITQFVHGIRILLFVRVGVYCRFVNGTASATRAPCLRAEPLATLYIFCAVEIFVIFVACQRRGCRCSRSAQNQSV